MMRIREDTMTVEVEISRETVQRIFKEAFQNFSCIMLFREMQKDGSFKFRCDCTTLGGGCSASFSEPGGVIGAVAACNDGATEIARECAARNETEVN